VTAPRLWSLVEIPTGEARRWALEGLHLYVFNGDDHWLMQRWWDPVGTRSAEAPVVAAEVPWEPANSEAEVVRIAVSAATSRVKIIPLSADLDVVSRPLAPLAVAPHARVRLYVSAPLWVSVVLVGADGNEIPIDLPFPAATAHRTWFGRNTTQGEVCYAERTRGRTDLAAVHAEHRPWRAVTPIDIENLAATPWRLDRVRLPVTALALFEDQQGAVWTPLLRTRRNEKAVEIEMDAADVPPPEAPGAHRLSPPRDAERASLVGRLYGSLFEAI